MKISLLSFLDAQRTVNSTWECGTGNGGAPSQKKFKMSGTQIPLTNWTQ